MCNIAKARVFDVVRAENFLQCEIGAGRNSDAFKDGIAILSELESKGVVPGVRGEVETKVNEVMRRIAFGKVKAMEDHESWEEGDPLPEGISQNAKRWETYGILQMALQRASEDEENEVACTYVDISMGSEKLGFISHYDGDSDEPIAEEGFSADEEDGMIDPEDYTQEDISDPEDPIWSEKCRKAIEVRMDPTGVGYATQKMHFSGFEIRDGKKFLLGHGCLTQSLMWLGMVVKDARLTREDREILIAFLCESWKELKAKRQVK